MSHYLHTLLFSCLIITALSNVPDGFCPDQVCVNRKFGELKCKDLPDCHLEICGENCELRPTPSIDPNNKKNKNKGGSKLRYKCTRKNTGGRVVKLPPPLTGTMFAEAFMCKNNQREIFNIGVRTHDGSIFIVDFLTSPVRSQHMVECLNYEKMGIKGDDYLAYATTHCLGQTSCKFEDCGCVCGEKKPVRCINMDMLHKLRTCAPN